MRNIKESILRIGIIKLFLSQEENTGRHIFFLTNNKIFIKIVVFEEILFMGILTNQYNIKVRGF